MLRELWLNDVNCGAAGRARNSRPVSAHTPVRSQDTLAVTQRTVLLSTERSARRRIASTRVNPQLAAPIPKAQRLLGFRLAPCATAIRRVTAAAQAPTRALGGRQLRFRGSVRIQRVGGKPDRHFVPPRTNLGFPV